MVSFQQHITGHNEAMMSVGMIQRVSIPLWERFKTHGAIFLVLATLSHAAASSVVRPPHHRFVLLLPTSSTTGEEVERLNSASFLEHRALDRL